MKVYGPLEYAQLEQVNGIGSLLGPATCGRLVQDISGAAAVPLFYTGSAWVNLLTGGSSTATQAANKIYAGPTSGGNALPTFRTLVAADIPALTFPTSSYFNGYFNNAIYWKSAATAIGTDMTPSSTPSQFTVRQQAGLTVTKAASNLPGITFTPASITAVYWIVAIFSVSNFTGNSYAETYLTPDGSTILATTTALPTTSLVVPCTLQGVYTPGVVTPVTVKIQGITGNASDSIQLGISSQANGIEWTVIRIF